jgi:hypothetical protein
MMGIFEAFGRRLLRRLEHCEGQTLVEYSLLLAFAATMSLAIAIMVGGVDGIVQDIGREVAAAAGFYDP